MTAKIKLNSASGGGSFSLQAPSSSSNNRVITLPDAADGTLITTTNPKSGSIIQVVQGTTSTEKTFTTASFVASNLSATITPTLASSKILIHASFLVDNQASGRQIMVALYRSINGGTFTNISGGSNSAAVGTFGGSSRIIETSSVVRLDTPSYSVGNSIVYKLYGKSESAAGAVIMNGQGTENVMVLQEVAA